MKHEFELFNLGFGYSLFQQSFEFFFLILVQIVEVLTSSLFQQSSKIFSLILVKIEVEVEHKCNFSISIFTLTLKRSV